MKSHRPRAIRPLDRYGGARTIRDSPSDVAACHRVVRRHTCCSPATRRSMRATQARAAPGVDVGQPGPKAASKLSHEALAAPRSAWGRTNRTVPIMNRHDSPWFESFCSHFALFWSFLLAISEIGICRAGKNVFPPVFPDTRQRTVLYVFLPPTRPRDVICDVHGQPRSTPQ